MKLKIALAKKVDLEAIVNLYDEVVDNLANTTNYPGWKKGIYPTSDEATTGIEKKELYVACLDDQIVGSIIINHEQENNYQSAKWNIDVATQEVYVIHTLAIHPAYKGLKIAQQLLEYVELLAKDNQVKTIRLDVRKGNIPAIKLYERCGYNYIGAINLDFRGADLGLFDLYEKIL